jgi:glycosyltransferase involved in cell wall biosynthesis
MSELVSILIPAYNAEAWIGDTIKSALNQTWPNKEIIIVDDGSSDNTLARARQFESNSVKVVTQENKGAPTARNTALTLAQGDYIQWLDADDLLAPDKITQQLSRADHGRDSRVLLSSPFGTFYYCPWRAEFRPTSLWRNLEPIEYFLTRFTDNVWFQPAAWLVSRKLTDMAGAWFEQKSPDDDGEYFSRVVASSEKIEFVQEAKSYYRVGNYGSLSLRRSDEALEALFTTINRCIRLVLAIEDSERTREASVKYLQHRLWSFYPEHKKLSEAMNELAVKLGGTIEPPSLGRKYGWIRFMLGDKVAKKIALRSRRAKSSILIYWDRYHFHNAKYVANL